MRVPRTVADGQDGLEFGRAQCIARHRTFGGSALYRYWRLPKVKLLAELDLLFHSLIELVDGRYAESWQSFCQKLEAAQAAPDRQAFTWGSGLQDRSTRAGRHSPVRRLPPGDGGGGQAHAGNLPRAIPLLEDRRFCGAGPQQPDPGTGPVRGAIRDPGHGPG